MVFSKIHFENDTNTGDKTTEKSEKKGGALPKIYVDKNKLAVVANKSTNVKAGVPPKERHVRFTLPPTDVSSEPYARSTKHSQKPTRLRAHNTHRSTDFRATVLPKKSTQPKVQTYVDVAVSPGIRKRVRPTARYCSGDLSPACTMTGGGGTNFGTSISVSEKGVALIKAACEGDEVSLKELLVDCTKDDLNACDSSGRTVLSHISSNGLIELLEIIIQLPGLDPNKPDNEGNTPLHFAAQAGQIECLNCLLSRCRGVDIDARNNLGFTPLMKAALQGRNKCAKLLLFAGANPTLRDGGRGFRADQWARFCGRYVCADVIERHARQRLLERSTSCGSRWTEHEASSKITLGGKIIPIPHSVANAVHGKTMENGFKQKLRKVFRTTSGPSSDLSSVRLVTQLTSAALCASSPVLPNSGIVPPVVKSLIRPLTVPRLQITLANNNGDHPNRNLMSENEEIVGKNDENFCENVVKPPRCKKK